MSVWNGAGKRIYMQEVGTRDGLQAETAFVPTADKIALVNALSHAGMAKIDTTGANADLVLCMSIHPGYSGQQFMPETVDRIRRLRHLLPSDVLIQVDGGVDERNVNELVAAGARLLVVGSHIFGARDVAGAYNVIADRAGARSTAEPAPL